MYFLFDSVADKDENAKRVKVRNFGKFDWSGLKCESVKYKV